MRNASIHSRIVSGKPRLISDKQGAAAVEFAMTIPIMATLLIGTMMVGNYLSVRNSLKSALDEASRYASLYPTPSNSQIRTRFDARMTRSIDTNRLTFNIQRASVSTQVKSLNMTASYPVNINFVFANAGTINATAERKIFVAN